MRHLQEAAQITFSIMAFSTRDNVPIDHRSMDEIYAAAQKESGALIVASGGDAQAQWDAFRSIFTKRFPQIKLDLTVDLSEISRLPR